MKNTKPVFSIHQTNQIIKYKIIKAKQIDLFYNDHIEMRNKNNSNVAQFITGDFSQYARSCAALSTEKQIDFQTMRYKDTSPLNIKAKAVQQYQQTQNQAIQLKSNNSNRGLQFYLSMNNQTLDGRISRLQNDQKAGLDQQAQKSAQDKNQSIKSLDTLKRRVLDTTLKVDKENIFNLISYPQTTQARNQTLRIFRHQEKNIFQDDKHATQNRQFTEDALFQEEVHKGSSIKAQQAKVGLQTDALNQEQNHYEGQLQQASESTKNVLNTSLSLNSRLGRKRNNVMEVQCLSQLNNYQSDIHGYQTIRNRQKVSRKSEGPLIQYQQCEQLKVQSRHSFQIGQQNNDMSNDDTSTAQFSQKITSNTTNKQISNQLLEQNYSLQNKTFLFPLNQQNIYPQAFNAKSQERIQNQNGIKNQSLKFQVNSERNICPNLKNLSLKREQNKYNFDSFKMISQDNSRLNKNNQEIMIKSEVCQTKLSNNQSNQEQNQNVQIKSKECLPLEIINKNNNIHHEEWNNNFFHLNSKNYNELLKCQLKTASNFNNINKDNQDQLKKTKIFFSSKQHKKFEPSQNNFIENKQLHNSPPQDVVIPTSPLASQDLNKISQKYTKKKENQNVNFNSQRRYQGQNREAKKQNRRGSSLMEQLEYEYNNSYYNQNFNSQQSQINLQNQNMSTLIQNNVINSSPLIQINQTPSQSFSISLSNNNNNNNKIMKKHNQHTSQLFSQISTFTNLNILEQEEDQGNESIKQLGLQKTPSIILATPSLSKYGSMNFDQQPQNNMNCKEINNYFVDMKKLLNEQIKLDQQFQTMIEQKLLINVDQFLYFLSHFWKFCIENFDNCQKDFAIFKIEEQYLQKINDIMNNFLNQQYNLSKEKISIFMSSFYFHSQRLILPKNLFEHIGGQNQAQKLINKIINHLKFDISFGVQFAKILSEIDPIKAGEVFCSFLKDDIEGIKEAIIYANQQLSITQVEFFLIKQTIYHVLKSEQLLRKDHKMNIIEKFEKLRAFILQDHTQLNLLQNQNIHEALMIKIRNSRQVFKKFKNKERQAIVDFAQFTFSMIFGRTTIQEYIEKLKFEIFFQPCQAQQQITDQLLEEFEQVKDKNEEEDWQLRLLSFVNEIEELVIESVNDFMDLSSIYNTEKHIKLKFQFIKESINKSFLSVVNKGSTLIKELRFWAVTNFKKYLKNIEMTEGENSRLDIMDSILKFYFYRKSDVFSFYDVPIAINYFPITKNAVEYWLIGLKAILNENRFGLSQSEIDTIINQIQSLFSVRWVKKKNQLFFIQTSQI
ncbi:hypothetical protein TTHERM_00294600 (macronuclear) [Tetrahymena thermophila SB210]|uniref:Uncharacterized protein n=1 Tax=Tetrahymena thermophila (strain SB210) TaxID=312017 RepID=I7LUD5_TETTS|nr:hypothetical protein TTHERM_00294600 [Tetrahymena thermophila SB210]EAR92847.2 hypothetical protein TTHERM_00294600 [Tetrahymena thermophila SB210]|eukprot:XP_001013092.2 hypothetical protein TTHERM_00294600 [Tetrahymena thermophila SB210]